MKLVLKVSRQETPPETYVWEIYDEEGRLVERSAESFQTEALALKAGREMLAKLP
jgi:hypothetical protein